MRRRWRNWCQNEVYEETKEADSRDKVKHNGRSDQLFLEMMMKLDEIIMRSLPTGAPNYTLYTLHGEENLPLLTNSSLCVENGTR